MISIVQINKQEYTALRKGGKLFRTPTGYDGISICSKRKKGKGKTYYVTDKLKKIAEYLVNQPKNKERVYGEG